MTREELLLMKELIKETVRSVVKEVLTEDLSTSLKKDMKDVKKLTKINHSLLSLDNNFDSPFLFQHKN
jgi:hypothetical protein